MKQLWRGTTVLLLSILALAFLPSPGFASGGAPTAFLHHQRLVEIHQKHHLLRSPFSTNVPVRPLPNPAHIVKIVFLPIGDVTIITSSAPDLRIRAGSAKPHPHIDPSAHDASILIMFSKAPDPGDDPAIHLKFSVSVTGVKPGDIIVSVDGKKLDAMGEIKLRPMGSFTSTLRLALEVKAHPSFHNAQFEVATIPDSGSPKSDFAFVK